MVKWLIRLVLVAFLLLLAVKLRNMILTDESKIQKRLDKLQQVISKKPTDQGTKLLLKSQQLPDLLHDPCVIELPDYEVQTQLTPREATAQLARMHTRLESLAIRFMDVEIHVNQNSATINCTVHVSGNDRLGTDPGSDTVEMICELRKSETDDVWRFTRFHQVDVLKR